MDLVPVLCVGGDCLLLVYISQQVNEMHGTNNVKYVLNVFSLSFQVSVCLSARGGEAPLDVRNRFFRHFHMELSDIICLLKRHVTPCSLVLIFLVLEGPHQGR
jgi:hypothetical protein